MSRIDITVQIEEPFGDAVDRAWVRRSVRAALSVASFERPAELSLVVAGDETVHALNAQHRGIDRTTDVLAFPLAESRDDVAFASPLGEAVHLGDVVVSLPRAREQAADHGHSLETELALLVVHGVLHLLGYDHENDEDETQMREAEKRAMGSLQRRGRSAAD